MKPSKLGNFSNRVSTSACEETITTSLMLRKRAADIRKAAGNRGLCASGDVFVSALPPPLCLWQKASYATWCLPLPFTKKVADPDVECAIYITPVTLPPFCFKKKRRAQPVPSHLVHRLEGLDAYGPCESDSGDDSEEADAIYDALAPMITSYLATISATTSQIEDHIGGLPHQRESTRQVTHALIAAKSIIPAQPGFFTCRKASSFE